MKILIEFGGLKLKVSYEPCRNLIFVRGHFRMAGDKIIYVKPHFRKR